MASAEWKEHFVATQAEAKILDGEQNLMDQESARLAEAETVRNMNDLLMGYRKATLPQGKPELFDVQRDNFFATTYLLKCQMDSSMSGSGTVGAPAADWEEPDWDAPAPAGWWQVSLRPCVWAFAWDNDTPCPQMEEISQLHREGEVLAMVESRRDVVHETDWLRLRDSGSFGNQWIPIDGSKMGFGMYSFGHFVRPLPTGTAPPPASARLAHQRAVQGRQTVRSKVQSVLNLATGIAGAKDTSLQTAAPAWPDPVAAIAGEPTRPHASTLARGLLFRQAGAGSALDPCDADFSRSLLRDGYAVASNVLPRDGPCGLDNFLKEMAELTKNTNLHQAPQQTAGQRGDRIVWVDEELATERYGVLAVRGALGLMKGLADALNPVLSKHHADRRGRGDPAHLSPLLPPATEEAVLTVPARAMAAVYPGGGARYIPHTDNKYRPALGTRANARELTVILYANPPDWEVERDGGALRLWPNSEHLEECPFADSRGGPRSPVTIAPLGGRLVVFFSALWHEVMPAHRERRALTLWVLRPDEACLSSPEKRTPSRAAGTLAAAALAATEPAAAPAPAATPVAPVRPARAAPSLGGSVWRVVGGSSSGGITVRMSSRLTSEELGRLAPGALIKQLSPEVSGRLEYIKLEGKGPEQGWVSLALKGRPLLRRE